MRAKRSQMMEHHWLVNLVVTVIGGLLVAFVAFRLGWNSPFERAGSPPPRADVGIHSSEVGPKVEPSPRHARSNASPPTPPEQLTPSTTVVPDQPGTGSYDEPDFTGLWVGTVASQGASVVVSRQSSGDDDVVLRMFNGSPQRLDQVVNLGRELRAYRPSDDAYVVVRLPVNGDGSQLIGEYLEDGTTRPISLSRRR
jgi:hypothetical protein